MPKETPAIRDPNPLRRAWRWFRDAKPIIKAGVAVGAIIAIALLASLVEALVS